MARLPRNALLREAARPVDIGGRDRPRGGRLTAAQQAALYYARKRRKQRMAAADTITNPFDTITVTAGVDMGSGDSGYYSTVYGSISAEPLADYPLLELATRNENYTQVSFVGDCTSIVSGWVPVIPGVTISTLISDWAFDGANTVASWNSTGSMSNMQQYDISWVQA